MVNTRLSESNNLFSTSLGPACKVRTSSYIEKKRIVVSNLQNVDCQLIIKHKDIQNMSQFYIIFTKTWAPFVIKLSHVRLIISCLKNTGLKCEFVHVHIPSLLYIPFKPLFHWGRGRIICTHGRKIHVQIWSWKTTKSPRGEGRRLQSTTLWGKVPPAIPSNDRVTSQSPGFAAGSGEGKHADTLCWFPPQVQAAGETRRYDYFSSRRQQLW